MKALILILTAIPFYCGAQLLTYSDLYKLAGMQAADVDSFLSTKGYVGLGVNSADYNKGTHLQWVHKANNSADKFNEITLTFAVGKTKGFPENVMYRTKSQTAYLNFQKALTARGYPPPESISKNGIITKLYHQNGTAAWYLFREAKKDNGFYIYSIGGAQDW
jgi:hypothetical protein